MLMTDGEFQRERRYQITMYFIRKMLEDGIISRGDYCQIDTITRRKFRPITGDLLSGNFLIIASKRANMLSGKGAYAHEEGNEA